MNLMWWRKKGQTFVDFFLYFVRLCKIPVPATWPELLQHLSSPQDPQVLAARPRKALLSQNSATSFDVTAPFASSPVFPRFVEKGRENRVSGTTGRGVRNASKARREACQAPCERQGTADLQMITAQISALPSRSAFAELCGN